MIVPSIRAFTVSVVVLSVSSVGLVLMVGCGAQPATPAGLDPATWLPADGQGLGSGGGLTGGSSEVLGLTIFASGAGGADIATDATVLDFGLHDTVRTFQIQNDSSAVLHFKVVSDLAWATVDPGSGMSGADPVTVAVTVDRARLSTGTHTGGIQVAIGAADPVDITLQVEAQGEPSLELSARELDLGTSRTHKLKLWNGGSGALSYTIESSVGWMSVQPSLGELSAETDTITVTVDRRELFVGPHTAQITVESSAGARLTVPVRLEKPNLSPKVFPWVEAQSAYGPRLEEAIELLRIWRKITDRAIVSVGPGFAHEYPYLESQVPGLDITPSLTGTHRLGRQGLDSLEAWELLGQDIAEVAEYTGSSIVALECEMAIYDYRTGAYDIDIDRFRECVQYVPEGIKIIWYPALYYVIPEQYDRSLALCQVLEEELDCRFVDVSFSDPTWPEYPPAIAAREVLDGMASNPTLPIIWIAWPDSFPHYWQLPGIHTIMEQLQGRPDVVIDPPYGRWFEAANYITAELSAP